MHSLTTQQIQRLQYLKPSTGFREDIQYNNFMYGVLSSLPTAVLPEKPSYARYVKEHIFDPLQMNSTTFALAVANATGKLADGFTRENINVTENPLGPGTTRVLPYFFPPTTENGDSAFHSFSSLHINKTYNFPRSDLRAGRHSQHGR